MVTTDRRISRRLVLPMALLTAFAIAQISFALTAEDSAIVNVHPWDELFGLAITPERAFIVGGNGLLLTSADDGKTWSRRQLGASGDGRPISDRDLFSVAFASNGRDGWIAGAGGLILASDDDGETWHRQASPTENALFKVAAIDNQRACAAGENGTLLCTTDGGLNWHQAQGRPSVTFFDLAFTSAKTGWASGEFQTVARTIDGGAHWTAVHSANSTSFEIPPYFTIVPAAGDSLWVTEQSGGAISSSDAGRNWISVRMPTTNSILAGAYTRAFARTGESGERGTIFLVGKHGMILASRNDGASWTILTPAPADLNDIKFGNGYGLAAGMQGTVLRTDDAMHWLRVN
jgi:photosystem II stability/assembly factor-like uncharacterized protein